MFRPQSLTWPFTWLVLLSMDSSSNAVKPTCQCCKTRLKITDFACGKCTMRFCRIHRLPETHACTYDFKGEGRAYLEKLNPKLVGKKIELI
jgi:hypothetical protein